MCLKYLAKFIRKHVQFFNFSKKVRKKILRENCLNPEEVKLSRRLRFGFSHLRDRKFKYSFLVSQLYIQLWYGTVHYLLHCPNYLHEKNPVGQHQICRS